MHQHQIEFLTYERQRGFLAEAEARRLANACDDNRLSLAQHIRCWIGAHLVQWGSALQGETVGASLESCL